MNAKIRNAQMRKAPYMLIVGDQEVERQTVSLRRRDGERKDDMPVAEFIELVESRIETRASQL